MYRSDVLRKAKEQDPNLRVFDDSEIIDIVIQKFPHLKIEDDPGALEKFGNYAGEVGVKVLEGIDNVSTDLTNLSMGTDLKPIRDRFGIKKEPNYEGGFVKKAGDRIGETWNETKNTVGNFGKELSVDKSIAENTGILAKNFGTSTYDTVGGVLNTGFGIVGDTFMSGLDTIMADETQEELQKMVARKYQEDGLVTKFIDNFQEFDNNMKIIKEYAPEEYKRMKAHFGVLEGVGGIFGDMLIKGTKNMSKSALNATKNQVKKLGGTKLVQDLNNANRIIETQLKSIKNGKIGQSIKGVGDNINNFRKADFNVKKEMVGDFIQPKKNLDNTITEVFQAQDKDILSLKNAIKEIDTDNISDYASLSKSLKNRISELSQKQDELLNNVKGSYKIDDFITSTDDGIYKFNFVEKAIDDLERYGLNRGDKEVLNTLKNFKKEKYSLKDVNDLARYYGTTFKDKAFKTNGDPKLGDISGSYENTRVGLKEIVRGKFGTEELKNIDLKISNLYRAGNYTSKIEEGVKKLANRVENRSLGARIGGKVAEISDVLSGGILKGFTDKFFPRNVGSKSFNNLDIQDRLADNLARVNKLMQREANMSDVDFVKEVDEIYNNIKNMKSLDDDLSILKPKYSITSKEHKKLVGKLKKSFEKIFPNQKIFDDYDEFLKHYKKLNNSGKNNIQFVKRLNEYNNKFNSDLDKLIKGELSDGYIMKIGEPGSILKASGIPDLQIELAKSLLNKKIAKHSFTAKDLKNLPQAIQEPIAVFNSSTVKGRKVIFTELKQGNQNFVVALELNVNRGALNINSIRSIYPRKNNKIIRAINNGEGIYFDNKKMSRWLDKQQSNSADIIQSSDTSTIIPQKIKNAKEIVKNFKNPEFDGGDINITKHIQYMKKPSGEVYGAKLNDGSIYLNPEKLNANTPIHEFSHLWEQSFPEKWSKGIKIFQNSKEGKRVFNTLKKDGSYKNLSDGELWSEALNFYIGSKGEFLYNSKVSKIGLWLRDLYRSIKKTFGLKTEITNKTTLKDFTDDVLIDLTSGKRLESMGNFKGNNDIQYFINNLNDGRNLELIRGTGKNGGSGKGEAIRGKGLYLTDDLDVAKHYGDKIEKFIIKNEKILDSNETLEKTLKNKIFKYLPGKYIKYLDRDFDYTYSQLFRDIEGNTGIDAEKIATQLNKIIAQKYKGLKYKIGEVNDALEEGGLGNRDALILFKESPFSEDVKLEK